LGAVTRTVPVPDAVAEPEVVDELEEVDDAAIMKSASL
jgi:hypothetical protein